ncbi:hypothetical protein ACIBCT_22820 [Streptosporangium sp. NPDC050855]|uniref:hypothetical protein n=1 Tax=Streptosporangium sp. NPDC050855 TaxID=3366194 RepID=UPI0037A9E555
MTRVYLEIGPKKVFACSVEWPGWCRIGRSEEEALEALATYARSDAPTGTMRRLQPVLAGGTAGVVAG